MTGGIAGTTARLGGIMDYYEFTMWVCVVGVNFAIDMAIANGTPGNIVEEYLEVYYA